MSEKLYKYIKKEGLNEKNFQREINNWSLEKIHGFAENCNRILLDTNVPKSSTFSFIASSTLSGDVNPCISIDCRKQNIEIMARFNALYSDSTLIQNPFKKYHIANNDLGGLRYWLIGDINNILYVKPLIDANLLYYIGKTNFCPNCYMNLSGDMYHKGLTDIRKSLIREYLPKVRINTSIFQNQPVLHVSGPEEIIPHGKHVLLPTTQNPQFNSFKQYCEKEKEIKNKKIKENILNQFVTTSIRDIVIQDVYSGAYGYNPITNNPLNLRIKAMAERKRSNIQINQSLVGLTHALPAIENIELTKLVQFRNSEEESFIVYRDKVNEILKEAKKRDKDEILDIFTSEIQPEINKLNLLVKKEKSKSVKSLLTKSVVGVGFISVGLYSGLVEGNIGAILTAIGGYSFIDGLTEKIARGIAEPEEVKKSQYYFLWKVQQLANKTK